MPPRDGALCTCGQCRRYKNLKRQFRAHCQQAGAPCWLCRQDIDYSLPPEHDESFSLDHRQPRSTHPHLTEDPANFEPSHLTCNKSRGNRAQPMHLGALSEAW